MNNDKWIDIKDVGGDLFMIRESHIFSLGFFECTSDKCATEERYHYVIGTSKGDIQVGYGEFLWVAMSLGFERVWIEEKIPKPERKGKGVGGVQ